MDRGADESEDETGDDCQSALSCSRDVINDAYQQFD